MGKSQCDHTLSDFCDETKSVDYFQLSKYVIQSLGYVDQNMKLDMDHNALTMVWEMRNSQPEAIHLCAVLEQLYIRFCYNKTKVFKESDSTQNEFLSVLIHVVDRVPAKEGDVSLQEALHLSQAGDGSGKVLHEDGIELWEETESILYKQYETIMGMDIDESEKQKMLLSVTPAAEGLGTPLHKGVYEMLSTKQNGFRDDQSTARRNELKDRIVSLGQLCLIAHTICSNRTVSTMAGKCTFVGCSATSNTVSPT